MGYFSKQQDDISKGWPTCLRAVAATVLLIQETWTLTTGQKITVYVPHMVISVLEQKGVTGYPQVKCLNIKFSCWNRRMWKLKITNVLNPAMFLESVPECQEALQHYCLLTTEQVYSSRQGLRDTPVEDSNWELFRMGEVLCRKESGNMGLR